MPGNAKRYIAVNNWKDLGHLDTYYSVKQSIFLNSRDFNSLDVDLRRGLIRKTSVNSSKLREEIRRIDTALDALWDEQRVLRAEVRFGDRAKIVAALI